MHNALAVFIFSLVSQLSWANTTANEVKTPLTLTPYEADYTATWKAGWFPITVDATRTLTQLENGLWQLTFEAYSSIADLHEHSQYSINDHTIQPHEYRYKTSGFLSKKRRAQTFNWEEAKVWLPQQDQWADYELTLGMQDNISYQEQIRLDLMAGKTTFSYEVTYKNRLKKYNFNVAKRGQTKTKQGLINTVEVMLDKGDDRETTRLWFAVDYEYLLIKLKTKKKNGDSNTITLKNAIMAQKTLKGF